jgi:hypothetical protein
MIFRGSASGNPRLQEPLFGQWKNCMNFGLWDQSLLLWFCYIYMQDLGEEDREIKCFGETATHYYIVITVGNKKGREYYKSSKKLSLPICRCHTKQGFRSDKPATNWIYFSYLVE